MAEVTARISRKEGDENDSDRGQQLIHGKEEAGEAPVKDKCRKKFSNDVKAVIGPVHALNNIVSYMLLVICY